MGGLRSVHRGDLLPRHLRPLVEPLGAFLAGMRVLEYNLQYTTVLLGHLQCASYVHADGLEVERADQVRRVRLPGEDVVAAKLL